MGYYTDFTLTAEAHDPAIACEAIMDFAEHSNYSWDIANNEATLHDAKFYDWVEKLEQASKRFPQVLFRLDGNGEENGDIWAAFAHNGVSERAEAKIVIEEPSWTGSVRMSLEALSAEETEKKRQARITQLEQELATLRAET